MADAGYIDLEFQSTLLMRGATPRRTGLRRQDYISIHAPHARSDEMMAAVVEAIEKFQSTLLMRGATEAEAEEQHHNYISIHAPHARSDT